MEDKVKIVQYEAEVRMLDFFKIFKEGNYRLYSLADPTPKYDPWIANMLTLQYPIQAFYGMRAKDGALELFYPQPFIHNLISHLMSNEGMDSIHLCLNKIRIIELKPCDSIEEAKRYETIQSILHIWEETNRLR